MKTSTTARGGNGRFCRDSEGGQLLSKFLSVGFVRAAPRWPKGREQEDHTGRERERERRSGLQASVCVVVEDGTGREFCSREIAPKINPRTCRETGLFPRFFVLLSFFFYFFGGVGVGEDNGGLKSTGGVGGDWEGGGGARVSQRKQHRHGEELCRRMKSMRT